MSALLRSVIDFESSVSQENLTTNFKKLTEARIEWTRPDDKRIYSFVSQYFQNHFELPSKATCVDYFERCKDVETAERIKDLEKLPAHIRTNYSHLVKSTIDTQNQIKIATLANEAKEIATKGLVIDKIQKQGPRDAINHFTSGAADLIVTPGNAKLRGNLRHDGQAVWDDYCAAETDKSLAWGKFTGLNDIDKICRGIKKGELWIHAGFAGQLKTTFALNWAYNLVTRYRSNVFYVSLEMPYEQLRRQIFALHSSNMKFKLMGYEPLDYRKIRDGELTPTEKDFWKIVIEDFSNNPEYGAFDVWRPAEDTTISEIKSEAEMFHMENEIGLIVIDHGELVHPQGNERDYLHRVNSIVRDTKKLALNFNQGEAVPVLLLWQLNRQGLERAEKRDGVYDLSSLSSANEAERSADVITTTYLDQDLRERGAARIANLKNRDNPIFSPFLASINWSCRRLSNAESRVTPAPGMGVHGIDDMFNVAA